MPEYTFDTLSRMHSDDLEALYRSGTSPSDLAVLGAATNGRMLAIRGLESGPIGAVLRAVAKRNIWVGKKFVTNPGGQNGHGANRIRLGQEAFRFVTRIGKSVLDGHDTVVFDYDLPGNSALARTPYDELREVSPGVFIGPVMRRTRTGSYTTVLWFALRVASV